MSQESFLSLKRKFRNLLNDTIEEKSNVIIGGSCVDYIQYRSEVSKIRGMEDAFDLFIQALSIISEKELDEEGDDE